MAYSEVLAKYHQLENNSNTFTFSEPPTINFQNPHSHQARPNSFSIEDAFFGDSGKGAVVAKLNALLSKDHPVVSLRYNGGANAGHETYVNGVKIVTSQLPMGVICENTTAIISRGMVLHPRDLAFEIDKVAGYFGKLPGSLYIDERVPLALDTHRALEAVFKGSTTGSKGSTNRGISPAYASVYLRNQVTLKDLLSDEWKDIFADHYCFYNKQVQGFGVAIEDVQVTDTYHPKETVQVGSEKQFLEDLSISRQDLKKYTSSDIYYFLKSIWDHPKFAVTLEGAQGPGLDPYHGVSPDYTASRPMSRHINDATYNVITPEEISLRFAVTKTTYMSSVGSRRLPTIRDEAKEKWIQDAFDETGRVSGRLRDIYPLSIPIAQYLRKAAGYHALVATHLDAGKIDDKIKVITHYTDKATGAESPYLPYQDELDKLDAHGIDFPEWDGKKIKNTHSWQELPIEAKKYLTFLSKTIAPVVLATTGPDLDEYISFLPNL